MPIDIQAEKLYRLPVAINKVFDHQISSATCWRWINRGIAGRKLEVVKLGNRTFTSIEALQRFCQRGGGDTSVIRTPAARERAIRRAEKELAADGI